MQNHQLELLIIKDCVENKPFFSLRSHVPERTTTFFVSVFELSMITWIVIVKQKKKTIIQCEYAFDGGKRE